MREVRELKDRIAARWPSAEAFYGERDDRTKRLVGPLAEYATRPVEIIVDPDAAEEAAVQRIALVAANLTVRWARRVRVVVPSEARLDETLRRDGHATLAERIEWEMRVADPFSDSTPAGEVEPLRLFVGPWQEGTRGAGTNDFQVWASSWTALGFRTGESKNTFWANGRRMQEDATVAAAALAGALGAGDLFKRAVGHDCSKWLRTFAWDTWSSNLRLGPTAWEGIVARPVSDSLDVGRLLLAGVGAIGSALVYIMDMTRLRGHLTLFDRDAVDGTNLNRSPLFTVHHAFEEGGKTQVAARWLDDGRHPELYVVPVDGIWRDHAATFGEQPFDVWISLTNEDGAWANVPFQLPPVVLHGTTTSGWGLAAGRHIPQKEDCTLCRMPRPEAEFRGPCAKGKLDPAAGVRGPIASLPFLSTASAALVWASMMQLAGGDDAEMLANDVSVDLNAGLPAVIALKRGTTDGCRGCKAMQSRAWTARGGRGRYAGLSNGV